MMRAMLQRGHASWVNVSMLVFVVDQVSKWAIKYFVCTSYRICSVLCFKPLLNHGASWGLGMSLPFANMLFLMLSLGLIVWVVMQARAHAMHKGATWAYGLIIGGAVSNVVDRLVYGAVFDFIMLHWADICWPIFNVADVAIVSGIVLLLVAQQ